MSVRLCPTCGQGVTDDRPMTDAERQAIDAYFDKLAKANADAAEVLKNAMDVEQPPHIVRPPQNAKENP